MLCLLGVCGRTHPADYTSRPFLSMKKCIILIFVLSLQACTPYAHAACQTELIQAAQNAAKDSMREAWQQGSEAKEQPVETLTAPDGSVALVKNLPREIVMLPNRELGLSGGTQITVVQAPAPAPQPTPEPTPEPSKVILRSNITEGEISAVVAISGDPGEEQMSAVEKVSTNHKNLAEEMLDLAWGKVVSSALLFIPLTIVPFLAVFFAFLYLMRRIKLEETKFAEKLINGGKGE